MSYGKVFFMPKKEKCQVRKTRELQDCEEKCLMGAGTLIKHHTISSKDYACRLHYMKTKVVIIFDSYPIAFVQAYLIKILNKT